jgi:hypothetical protein
MWNMARLQGFWSVRVIKSRENDPGLGSSAQRFWPIISERGQFQCFWKTASIQRPLVRLVYAAG